MATMKKLITSSRTARSAPASSPAPRSAPTPIEDPWENAKKPVDRSAIIQGAVDKFGEAFVESSTIKEDPWTPYNSTNPAIAVASQEQAVQEKKDEVTTDGRQAWDQGIGAADGMNRVVLKQLTWDEYNALTPEKKAVVDLNTAFIQAGKNDEAARQAGASPDDSYNKTVEGLFGKNGGSEKFAPETVALLDKLGLKNERNDLDNYLSQASLVSERDLRLIEGKDTTPEPFLPSMVQRPDAPAGIAVPQERVSPRVEQAIQFSQAGQRTLSSVLANGQSLLEAATGTSVFNPATDGQLLTELDEMFEYLADRGNTADPNLLPESIAYFQSTYGAGPDKIGQYLENRLNQFTAKTQLGESTTLGNTPGADYLTPEEFRAQYYKSGG